MQIHAWWLNDGHKIDQQSPNLIVIKNWWKNYI